MHRWTGLRPPVKCFTDRSKAVLLLWIVSVFLSCACYAFVCVCLYVPCGHLLEKGWPLGSCLWCLAVSLLLSHWYPRSGVVVDCIDSWSLHPYLLWYNIKKRETVSYNKTIGALFFVNIRISQTENSDTHLGFASVNITVMFSGWLILIFTSKVCIIIV